MPLLDEILKKTKSKSEQVKIVRKPPSIATEDRPCSLADAQIASNHQPLEKDLESIPTLPFPAKDTPEGSNQSVTKGVTKETQRGYKGVTNKADLIQIKGVENDTAQEGDTKGLQKGHVKNKGDTKGTPKGPHKGLQREHKNIVSNTHGKGAQREHKYSHLRGWNKQIVDLIHDICRETVSKVTYPLTNNMIAEMINMPSNSIKTTMQRLKVNRFLLVTDFNDGRGGWSRYTLPEEFFTEIPLTERVQKGITKEAERGHKGDTKGATQGDTNSSCSSSFKDLKTTTTEPGDEWNFDITPYVQFGFTKTQIKQLANSGVISAIDVEQSLIEFSYDLDNNALPSIKTTKINFLMGLLWKGQTYVSEGFKNEQDAMIIEMSHRAEGRRKSLLEAKFGAWESCLTNEQKGEIEKKLPVRLMASYRTHGISDAKVKEWMFDYYMQNVKE